MADAVVIRPAGGRTLRPSGAVRSRWNSTTFGTRRHQQSNHSRYRLLAFVLRHQQPCGMRDKLLTIPVGSLALLALVMLVSCVADLADFAAELIQQL